MGCYWNPVELTLPINDQSILTEFNKDWEPKSDFYVMRYSVITTTEIHRETSINHLEWEQIVKEWKEAIKIKMSKGKSAKKTPPMKLDFDGQNSVVARFTKIGEITLSIRMGYKQVTTSCGNRQWNAEKVEHDGRKYYALEMGNIWTWIPNKDEITYSKEVQDRKREEFFGTDEEIFMKPSEGIQDDADAIADAAGAKADSKGPSPDPAADSAVSSHLRHATKSSDGETESLRLDEEQSKHLMVNPLVFLDNDLPHHCPREETNELGENVYQRWTWFIRHWKRVMRLFFYDAHSSHGIGDAR